jgi:hypothetical protein
MLALISSPMYEATWDRQGRRKREPGHGSGVADARYDSLWTER